MCPPDEIDLTDPTDPSNSVIRGIRLRELIALLNTEVGVGPEGPPGPPGPGIIWVDGHPYAEEPA